VAIEYFEEDQVFKLDTPNTSYMIGIIGEEKFVTHIYYGRKMKSHRLVYLMGLGEPAYAADEMAADRQNFLAESVIIGNRQLGYGQRADIQL
jgi:alpha-galactosidase